MPYIKKECPICEGEMWDNRNRKKGNQPDFKCKDKECDGAIWLDKEEGSDDRPRNTRSNGAAKSNGAKSNGAELSKDDYYTRKDARDIQGQARQGRAHSQEMALRYYALAGTKPKNWKEFDAIVSRFDRDLNKSAAATQPAPAPKPEPEPEPAATATADEEEGLIL